MAAPDIKKIPPLPISDFRKLDENATLHIPEIPKNRKCTDIVFLIFFIVSVLTSIILATYSIITGTDYNRFLNGYDKCGDTCGTENKPIPKINCSGKDLRQYPLMKFKFTGMKNGSRVLIKNHMIPDTCIRKCNSSDRLLFHRCIPHTDMDLSRKANKQITFLGVVNDLSASVIVLIIPMIAFSFVLSLVLLFCFYCSPKRTVFTIFVATIISLLCFAGYVWYKFTHNTSDNECMYMGIVATVIIFFLSIFICYFHDRYLLIIDMFEEASTAIFKLPGLILLPFVSILVLCITFTSLIFSSALISTNQDLQNVENFPSVYEYAITEIGEASITYICLISFWILAFANGCQCIIVAAPVSAYYFQTDKSKIHFPVLRSCFVLIRYHLGTVAFGSLCITILTVARVSVHFLEDYIRCNCVVTIFDYVLTCLDEFIEYLTKRAYIQTAMHGKSLYKSGMRAARLLWANLLDTVSLDVVAHFIMCCAVILTVLVAAGLAISIHYGMGYQLVHFWSILAIGACSAGAVVYFFTEIINVAVETIFLCFCEDKLLNNGKDRPYMMSTHLKTIIDKAKAAAKKREGN